MADILRIASGQGFWGDDLDAPVRQVEEGPIDVLMLDYLAEVTMSIMQKQRDRDPSAGYARDFVPLMKRIFPAVAERGIRVITNAGGVNPEGCANALVEAGREAGVAGRALVGRVEGDDILERLPQLIAEGHSLDNMETGEPLESILDRVRSANVYIGAAPIVEALKRGAHVIVTGRSTDTALTYGAMMHAFGWSEDDHDRLAAGVVAGHINECGAQSTGGNCLADWWTMPDMARVGFPIVEAHADGSFVVTKHAGTGGRVTRRTVTEQIVYEMGDPTDYITPDVVADFTTIRLEDDGPDRVRVTGVKGGPRTPFLKASIAYSDGWKATGTLTYSWPDAAAKARAADRVLRERMDRLGLEFDEIRTELVGWDSTHGALVGEPPADLPEVQLRVGVRGSDRAAVERFTRELAPLILTGPPSVTGFAGGRPRVQEIMAYWPALIRREAVEPGLSVDVLEV
ncbi:acyclic terpene utilization AtuA family protein [Gaopeijia maritima]|uniref:Acyclic terpene utilization AtuA family protein n=1 Tax=Gaopeijia maritima TaxID=3119007 RepID=A0ABU9EAA7_9BACT